MNLHAIVSGAIGAVNPFITATIQVSAGSTTYGDGSRVPAYTTTTARIQNQALQYNEIAQLDGLNVQGVRRKIYLNGNWNGIIRADGKGGDLLLFPEQPGGPIKTWLVVIVFEYWPDWCSLGVTLQVN